MGLFTETDAATLQETVIEKLQSDIGETLYPGDERRIFAQSLIAFLVITYNSIDSTAKKSLLKYATDEILDAIGDGYDCTRLAADEATTTLRFSMNSAYTADVTIPEGTRAATSDGHYFATDEEATITQGDTYVDVSASAVEGGSEYNDYTAGSITIMVDLLSYIDSVTNTTATEDGSDEEEDDAYRERIRLAMTKFSTAGPKNAWKYWALSADSDIADAYVENPSANEIEITIVMSDGSLPSDTMIAKVQEVVEADDVRPLGDEVTVLAPTAESYDIELTYYVSSVDEDEAVAAIEDDTYTDADGNTIVGALTQYKAWQNTVIGRDINPDKLKKLMMDPAGDGSVAGAYRIEITSPVYTELTGATVAQFSGTLTISHVVNDDA